MFLFSNSLLFAQDLTPRPLIREPDRLWIYLTIFILIIIFLGIVLFMFHLQREYMKACIRDNQLAIFADSPAGLPRGTIRAMISFIIIAISLYLSVLLFFQVVGEGSKFPDALSSLLGAVVGFYFGSKVGEREPNTILQEQVKTLKTEKDEGQSTALLQNIKKGIDMSKAVIGILPEEQKKKYSEWVNRLEQGYSTVSTLTRSGGVKDAVAEGQKLFEQFRKENPARDTFAQALNAFSQVLGGSGAAMAVIATVVAGSVQLVGSAYEKWKKRILDVPISPVMLPLQAVDANTGLMLLLQSPILKKKFAAEMEANDRSFMTNVIQLLNQENMEDFWNVYKSRFDSRDQFEHGIQELRRAALDNELAMDTMDNPAIFAQAGGLEAFMQSIDRINSDDKSKAALHQLAMMIEELQRQGEPVPTIFEKVRQEDKS